MVSALGAGLGVQRAYHGVLVWVLWMAATFIGGVLYFVPVGLVHIALGLDRLGDPQRSAGLTLPMLVLAAVLCGAACGLSIGLAQWVVLRRELRQIGGWVAATLVGYGSIGLLPLIANAFQPGWMDWALTLIINGKMHWLARVEPSWPMAAWLPGAITLTLFGAVLGLVQWLVLRGRVVHAGWWIAISAGAWALAALGSSIGDDFWVTTATWELPMAATGVGLVWLLRRGVQVSKAAK